MDRHKNLRKQPKFKKDFAIINQFSHQNANTSVEKDLYKLMDNSNFGYDCRNNIDDCKSTALYDESFLYTKMYFIVF